MRYTGPFKKLGTALKQLRHSRGWTQEELAHRAGVSVSNLSDYERGVAGIKVEILDRMLLALKCDVGDLADELGQVPTQREMLTLYQQLLEEVRGLRREAGGENHP